MDALKGKKTYIIAFLMVVIGAINMITGDATGMAMITEHGQVLLTGLLGATIRSGVANS
jgi:hypothetical protein